MLGRLTVVLIIGIGVAMVFLGQPAPKPHETAQERITETVLDRGDTPVIEVAEAAPAPDLTKVTPTAVGFRPGTPDLVENALAEAMDGTATADGTAGLVTVAVAEAMELPDASATLYVTGNRVNLRDGPSVYDPVVVRLNQGDRARLIADAGHGWLLIRALDSGRQGFMAAEFLSPRPPGN